MFDIRFKKGTLRNELVEVSAVAVPDWDTSVPILSNWITINTSLVGETSC